MLWTQVSSCRHVVAINVRHCTQLLPYWPFLLLLLKSTQKLYHMKYSVRLFSCREWAVSMETMTRVVRRAGISLRNVYSKILSVLWASSNMWPHFLVPLLQISWWGKPSLRSDRSWRSGSSPIKATPLWGGLCFWAGKSLYELMSGENECNLLAAVVLTFSHSM